MRLDGDDARLAVAVAVLTLVFSIIASEWPAVRNELRRRLDAYAR